MTVKTLIEALQDLDENLEVLLKDGDEFTSYLYWKFGIADNTGANPFIFNFKESKENPNALYMATPSDLL